MNVQLKRIYDPYSTDDGLRILVDRLWPRGVSKSDAHVDIWLKDIAPSTELRKWFHADIGRFEEFKVLYENELNTSPSHIHAARQLRELLSNSTATLLFASKDPVHNHAGIILAHLHQTSSES